MIDPHRLAIFRSVMTSGSIQAAADHLMMTSSAVSQHMSAFQRELGLTLFVRQGRGIIPTPAAQTLLAESEGTMAAFDRLDAAVESLRAGRIGRLSIGYFSSVGQAWMPYLARTLTREMPGLTLELILTEGALRAPDPDIELVVDAATVPAKRYYQRIALLTEAFVAVVPTQHPLAGAASVELRDLRSERWISNDELSTPGHAIVVSACTAAGFTPQFTIQAQDQFTAMAFVAAGLGITVLPALASVPLPFGVVRLAIGPNPPVRTISADVRPASSPNPAATRALELLRELSAQGVRIDARSYDATRHQRSGN